MNDREPRLKTKRLYIQPMSTEEICAYKASADNEWLRDRISEREKSCADDHSQRIWYAPWKVCLRDGDDFIGVIAFNGPQEDNTLEVLFDTFEAYQGHGYTSEALRRVVRWAFNCPEVFFVEASATDHCHAAKKVLEKLEFKPDGVSAEGMRYVKSKSEPWVAVYMCFGMAIGCAIGGAYGNTGVGLSLGICAGMAVGTAIDTHMKKSRARQREARKEVEI